MFDLSEKLTELRTESGLIVKTPCTEEEKKLYFEYIKNKEALPDGVKVKEYTEYGEKQYSFYTLTESNLSDQEKSEYILLKQLKSIETIKKCMIFFTALTIISLIFSFFAIGNIL